MRTTSLAVLALFCCFQTILAQAAVSTRAGRRPLLPRAEEIALARSAAPSSVSGKATVLVLADSGFVKAEVGTAPVTCVVHRSWRDSLEPQCYDSESAKTILPIEELRLRMRQAGRDEVEINKAVAEEIRTGRIRLPMRPAMTYMMSAAQVLYDDDGKRVGAWHPHIMIFYPFLTNESVGLGDVPDMRIGTVSESGSAEANLMIVMPKAVVPQPVTKSP